MFARLTIVCSLALFAFVSCEKLPFGKSKTSVEDVNLAPPAPAEPELKEYTVVSGDSPWSIAQKFNISTKQLMEANGIDDPRKLQVGQTLKIPGAAADVSPAPTERTAAAPKPPTPAPTPAPAATPTPAPKPAPPKPTPPVTPIVTTPAPKPPVVTTPKPTPPKPAPKPSAGGATSKNVYIVQPGDDLLTVSEKFGVDIAKLIQANGLKAGATLTPGSAIVIP